METHGPPGPLRLFSATRALSDLGVFQTPRRRALDLFACKIDFTPHFRRSRVDLRARGYAASGFLKKATSGKLRRETMATTLELSM